MISSGESGTNKLKTINRRMFILSAAKIIVFGGIIARLFTLQISDTKKYITLSDKNRLREWRLPPVRGEILDYFGNTIAANVQVFQLHVIPEDVKDFNYLMMRLKTIIKLSDKNVRKIYKRKKKQRPWETLIISENLSWEEFSKLNLYLHELNGAKPVFSVSRNYPHKDKLTHVLGYVSKASENDLNNYDFIKENHVTGLRVGKTGLEKSLEKELIGKNGIQRYEVNAFGKRISQVDHLEGKKGTSFYTTVDTEVQKLCYELLKDRVGSISVMDIYTGDIVAMHSSPSFDPNLFTYGISNKNWKEIRENPHKPLLNKSVAGLYSPGSTIKPIVALSALEHDIVSPKKKFSCTGKIELYGQTYHCWKDKGHGVMNLRNAIKQSCDVYFYEMTRKLGVDRLNRTAKKFGLGEIVLNGFYTEEKKGLFPSTKWKKNALGTGWVLGETLITGIGQGYTQTTPLQLCLMTAQLANGGFKIFPRIILDKDTDTFEHIKKQMQKELERHTVERSTLLDQTTDFFTSITSKYKPLFKNPENIKFVLDAMYGSTNEAGGTSFASRLKSEKYRFAGKTGTSQVKKITKKERELELKTMQIPYKERDHALYIAFGPYKNPRYALSILVEHGGSGSATAAPMAKKLFKLIIDRHEEREKIRLQRIASI